MDRPTDRSPDVGNGRMRPSLRLGLFLLLFVLFAVIGHLAIAPLPRAPMQWASLVVLTMAAVLAGAILLARVDGRPVAALGFPLGPFAFRESLLGLAVGSALIAAAIGILLLTRSAHFVTDSGSFTEYFYFLAWTFVFFSIAAAFEEAVFRGYPFQVLVEWIGAWPAILLASSLFSLLHSANPNVTPLALVNIFLAGVLLSIAYLKTLSLWFATGLHVGWNWAMAGLFDFPVSGLEFDTPLYTGVPGDSDWWTGGAFGPEAGLVGTIVILGGTLWLARSGAFRPTRETLASRPLPLERLEHTTAL
jgi:uncharacterized protein